MAMTFHYKFVLPINLILALVLGASLAREWRRQEATGMALWRARLDEEARFVQAAYRAFGMSPRFDSLLRALCHASDAPASPEHQVALQDEAGAVVTSAAEHARRPMKPTHLAALGEGFWTRNDSGEIFLVRVSADGGRRVVVAESTRAVRGRMSGNLKSQAGWFLGAAVLLIGAVNVVMRQAVLRPIGRLTWAVRQLEQGRFGASTARLHRRRNRDRGSAWPIVRDRRTQVVTRRGWSYGAESAGRSDR
jgi:phosphoserine phosphatase RsbU/P